MTLDEFDNDMVNEYRIRVTVRNNLILTAIEKAGYKNQSAFCREAEMPATALSGLISMKNAPLLQTGEFSYAAKKLMEILCLAPTDLWTSEQLTLRLKSNSAEREPRRYACCARHERRRSPATGCPITRGSHGRKGHPKTHRGTVGINNAKRGKGFAFTLRHRLRGTHLRRNRKNPRSYERAHPSN